MRERAALHPGKVITTRIHDARAVSEEELAQLFLKEGCTEVIPEREPERAWQKAKVLRGDGIVFCVGSLYLAGELLKAARKNEDRGIIEN